MTDAMRSRAVGTAAVGTWTEVAVVVVVIADADPVALLPSLGSGRNSETARVNPPSCC